MNKEILKEVDDLVSYIKNHEQYQRYQAIALKMKNNKDIMSLINKYKDIEKQIVYCEYNKKLDEVSLLEKELKSLEESLNNFPIYVEYISLQEELNDIFSLIKLSMDNYFDNLLNKN